MTPISVALICSATVYRYLKPSNQDVLVFCQVQSDAYMYFEVDLICDYIEVAAACLMLFEHIT